MKNQFSVFAYQEYKPYLREILRPTGQSRGTRSKLAEHLNCQTAFVSQVLNGHTHFSLEHALKISEFLGHSEEERHFFMLLVEHDRAGSEELKIYYRRQSQGVLARRAQVQERIQVKRGLGHEAQEVYYGAWYFAAIHILLSIPEMQTKAALSRRLRLPTKVISDTLEFLSREGLAEPIGERYKIGSRRIHLGKGSRLLTKHHLNWRLRAMQSMDEEQDQNLHYSSVISLSRADASRVKEMILALLENVEPILKESPEEDVFAFAIDFFPV